MSKIKSDSSCLSRLDREPINALEIAAKIMCDTQLSVQTLKPGYIQVKLCVFHGASDLKKFNIAAHLNISTALYRGADASGKIYLPTK